MSNLDCGENRTSVMIIYSQEHSMSSQVIVTGIPYIDNSQTDCPLMERIRLARRKPQRRQRRVIPVSRQNLIRAGNGASHFVPRIEKRTWTRLRVALRSAKVLFNGVRGNSSHPVALCSSMNPLKLALMGPRGRALSTLSRVPQAGADPRVLGLRQPVMNAWHPHRAWMRSFGVR
jgi:hypothetical protein